MANSHGDTPTIKDVDALLSGATPQFSQQLRARLVAMIDGMPADSDVALYAAKQIELLDRMAQGTTRAN